MTAAVSCVLLLSAGKAAQPFNSATITKLENRVSFGDRRAGRGATRPAAVSDVLRPANYLLSEADSRAEIQYPDGSLVRIGQNTVFSFDSESRTLSLDRGSLIFHIPKGSGGGAIKTPSLTAAITGTTGKVSANIIAIVEGVVKLVPSGRLVRGGEFARRNADGSITIAPFDQSKVNDGRLVFWDQIMPGFEDKYFAYSERLPELDLRYLETLHRANNLPNQVNRFFVDRNRNRVRAPRDREDGAENQRPNNPPIY